MSTPLFIGHEIYRSSTYGSGHPLAIPRVSLAMDLARALGWLDEGNFRESPQAGLVELADFHDPGYLQALMSAEQRPPPEEDRVRYNIGINGNPLYPEMFRRPATACGGGLLAVELLKSAATDTIFNIAGGQHHGLADRASGFCYLNEPVLTIRSLLKAGAKRVFYLDLDAHFGDGTQLAFHDDPRVFTLSVHEHGRWPQERNPQPGDPGTVEDRAGGQARNLPVPKDFNDTELGFLMDHVVLPLIARHGPDVVYLQAGCDALADDPQSKLSLSNGALWSAVRKVKAVSKRLIVAGGGGYNPFTVGRCWAGVWAVLNDYPVPEKLSPGAELLLRQVSWRHRQGRTPPESWFTTLADPSNEGGVCDELYALAEKSLKE